MKEKDVAVFMFEDKHNLAIFIKSCIINILISEMQITDNTTVCVRLTAPGLDRIWREAKLANVTYLHSYREEDCDDGQRFYP